MKRVCTHPVVVVLLMLLCVPDVARAQVDDKQDRYLGQITMFAGDFAPKGWALCDGKILPIVKHQRLFAILGAMYGGDGRSTFALPDLRGRGALGTGQGVGLTLRLLGRKGGVEAHTSQVQSLRGSDENRWPAVKTTMPPFAAVNYIICINGINPTGSDPKDPRPTRDDGFLGEITMFAGNSAPVGYAFCEGQLLQIRIEYEDEDGKKAKRAHPLFYWLGNTYGGDGVTTFALPDLRGRVAIGAGKGPGLTSHHQRGAKGGVEAHAPNYGGIRQDGSDRVVIGQVDNMPPFTTVNYMICVSGPFQPGETFLGEITMYGAELSAVGKRSWALCLGQLLPINSNQSLRSILGSEYGGDGRSTIALPDLRGRMAIGAGEGPELTERHRGPAGGSRRGWGAESMDGPETNHPPRGDAVQVFKPSKPLTNMPPFIAVNYIMCTVGEYPSRTDPEDPPKK